MLVPTPESAYDVCKEFMPDCSQPLGYFQEASAAPTAAPVQPAKKRQLPLTVTSSDTLAYSQAPNGSYVVSKLVYIIVGDQDSVSCST